LPNHLRQLDENVSGKIASQTKKDYSQNKDRHTRGKGIQVNLSVNLSFGHLRHPCDREQAALLRLTD
jgi:hypothetical protein